MTKFTDDNVGLHGGGTLGDRSLTVTETPIRNSHISAIAADLSKNKSITEGFIEPGSLVTGAIKGGKVVIEDIHADVEQVTRMHLTPAQITSRMITADKPLASTLKRQSFLLIPPAEIQAMKKEIKDCHEEMALMVVAMQKLEDEIKRLHALVPEIPKLGIFDDTPEWTQPRSLLPRGL